MTCSHDPRKTVGPIGMYHCPECGQMVVAGFAHPDYDKLDKFMKDQKDIPPEFVEIVNKNFWDLI